jgi:hypothetical protein
LLFDTEPIDIVFGSEKFENQVELKIGRRTDPSQRSRDRESEAYLLASQWH